MVKPGAKSFFIKGFVGTSWNSLQQDVMRSPHVSKPNGKARSPSGPTGRLQICGALAETTKPIFCKFLRILVFVGSRTPQVNNVVFERFSTVRLAEWTDLEAKTGFTSDGRYAPP